MQKIILEGAGNYFEGVGKYFKDVGKSRKVQKLAKGFIYNRHAQNLFFISWKFKNPKTWFLGEKTIC